MKALLLSRGHLLAKPSLSMRFFLAVEKQRHRDGNEPSGREESYSNTAGGAAHVHESKCSLDRYCHWEGELAASHSGDLLFTGGM